MNEKEFFESIAKVRAKDPEKAEAIFRKYKEDPTRTWEDLELLASKAPADVIARESKGTRLPLAEAYHLSEDQLRSFIDPNSRTNWMTMDTDQLLKGAMDAGYVRRLDDKATPEEKQARREEFGRFLNYLAQASTDPLPALAVTGLAADQEAGNLSSSSSFSILRCDLGR